MPPFKRLIVRVLGSWADILYMPVYSLIAMLTISLLVYLFYKNPVRLLYRIPSPWAGWWLVDRWLLQLLPPKLCWMDPIGSDTLMIIWTKGFWSNTPKYQGHLPVGKGSLPALSIDHDAAHSLYDCKYPCNIHFDHHIPVSGISALGKEMVSQFGDEYREYQKRVRRIIPHSEISLEILINSLLYTATTCLFSLNRLCLAFSYISM